MSVRRETSFHVPNQAMQTLEISHAALVMMGALIQQVDPYNGLIQAVMGMSLASYGEMLMVSVRPAITGSDVWIVSQSAQPTAMIDWGKNDQNLLAFSNSFRQISLQYSLFPETVPPASDPEPEKPVEKLAYDPFSTDEFHKLPKEAPPAPKQPELVETPSKHRVFISYRRSDSNDVCGRLYDQLERKLGAVNVFKDVDNIPYGVDFVDYLDQQVQKCTCLLAVIGPTWVNTADAKGNRRLDDPNDFVRIEIESALKRTNIAVVPVLVKGAVMPSTHELPETLQALVRRNGISLRDDPDFHGDVVRLVNRLG